MKITDPEMMNLLMRYRGNYIANGAMETTGDAVVEKLRVIFTQMNELGTLKFQDGKITGLNGALLQDWQGWMVSEGKAERTRQNYTILLNEFLRWGAARDIFPDYNSAVQIWTVLKPGKLTRPDKIPEDQRKQMSFSPAEVERLITEMPSSPCYLDRDRAIVALFVGSGIRNTALCDATIGDYRKEPGMLYIRNKGGALRPANVAEFAVRMVDKYLESRKDKDDMSAPLFLNKYGRKFDRRTMHELISSRQKKLGMVTGVHKFRHSFATATEKAGGPAVARDLCMHRSFMTTNIYANPTEEDKKAAVNALPWNNLSF